MKLILFAAKRILTSPVFLLLLIGIALLPVFFGQAGKTISPQPAGFVCEGQPDKDAARVCTALLDSGFVRLESEEKLRDEVSNGRLDAGVVVPADLTDRLAKGAVQNALSFIKSPTTLLGDLWQEHAAAALFSVYAPYITASSFAGSEVTAEEVFEEYYRMLDGGYLFRFEISTDKGRLVPDTERSRRFFTGALAILLYITSFFAVALPLMKAADLAALRMPPARARRSILLPGLLLRLLLIGGACALACHLAELPNLLIPAMLCLLCFTGLHLLALVLPGKHWQPIAVMLLAAAGVALCPIYTDLSLFVPAAETVRKFIPPYWLWIIADKALYGFIGAGAFLFLLLLLCLISGRSYFIQKCFKKVLL